MIENDPYQGPRMNAQFFTKQNNKIEKKSKTNIEPQVANSRQHIADEHQRHQRDYRHHQKPANKNHTHQTPQKTNKIFKTHFHNNLISFFFSY
jgi:hypothetical protein